jgi:hypothetical protein
MFLITLLWNDSSCCYNIQIGGVIAGYTVIITIIALVLFTAFQYLSHPQFVGLLSCTFHLQFIFYPSCTTHRIFQIVQNVKAALIIL